MITEDLTDCNSIATGLLGFIEGVLVMAHRGNAHDKLDKGLVI